MRRFDWVAWLSISSNLAVIVGVVLVVIQLRQNADLLEFQILKQETDNYIESDIILVGTDYPRVFEKMLKAPQEITLAEARVIEASLWGHNLVRWRNLYDLFERGLLDESSWQRIVGEDLDYVLAHPYGRAWWEESRTYALIPEELTAFIDQRLSESPNNATREYHDKLIQRVGKIQQALVADEAE